MSAAPKIVRAVPGPDAATPPPATQDVAVAPGVVRRLALGLRNEWLPRVVWTIGRTGRPGLAGIALLLAAALFFFSTHLEVAAQVELLRADLAVGQGQARPAAAAKGSDPTATIRALPARTEMPAILRQLFSKAAQMRLAVETGKYEINATASGGVVRYQVAFPVTGPYPQIRAFIDATLASMPAVSLSELALDRRSIADASVEALLRITVYTVATGTTPGHPAVAGAELAAAEAQPRASRARLASDRVVASTRAASLFAPHSWFVAPPPPPPAEPPPPPEPTAPPFPYTCIGSFAPAGHAPVFFLARGDHVIDAHVGDLLDGVYQFESVTGDQLVFVYLPLKIRQTVSAGASQ